MSKDHFAAVTYLKHFSDPAKSGLLYGYRKDGKSFPCKPEHVCHEWRGDYNDSDAAVPRLLGDYREMFEPYWNEALSDIEGGSTDRSVKFSLAGYIANLMTCTPAWRRINIEMKNTFLRRRLIDEKNSRDLAVEDPELHQSIQMIEAGEIKIETAPDDVRATVTRQLLFHTLWIYNEDWLLISNRSGHPFVTSDNPVAIVSPRPQNARTTRIVPLTPKLCVQFGYSHSHFTPTDPGDIPRLLALPPAGKIRRRQCSPTEARTINTHIIKAAEDLVLSSTLDEKIGAVTNRYRRYGLTQTFFDFIDHRERSMHHVNRIDVGIRSDGGSRQ